MVVDKESRMTTKETIIINDEDDDDDMIDSEQLQEYREMVEQLGSFPVRLRSLSCTS
jgi:hypothetical protein